MSRKNIVLKTVSGMLILAFGLQEMSYAAGAELRSIRLPKEIVSQQTPFHGQKNETIVHIQDAHDSLESQERITDILNTLVSQYEVRSVALEGSSGDIDPLLFKSYPDQKVAQAVAYDLVKEGRLNAGEFFAITSEKPVAVYGAEDRTLYREDLKAFRDLLKAKDKASTALRELAAAKKALEEKVYSEKIKAIRANSALSAASDGHFAKKWNVLEKIAADSGMDTVSSPALKALSDITRVENKIRFDEANKERTKLLSELRDDALVQKAVEFKAGKITDTQFYGYLAALCRDKKIDLARYPNLKLYFDYIALFDALDLHSLIEDLEAFEAKLIEANLKTADEKALYALSKELDVTVKLVSGEATSKEWNSGKGRRPGSSDFIALCQKYGIRVSPNLNFERISAALPKAERFYRLADERNIVMVENTLKKMRAQGQTVAALVTGGFHADGISRALRNDKLSYLLVMPKLKDANAKRPYLTILTRRAPEYTKEFSKPSSRFQIMMGTALDTANAGGAKLEALVKPLAAKLSAPAQERWIRSIRAVRPETAQRVENVLGARLASEPIDIARNPLTHQVITIDGISGSGKGTVARELARRLGYLHVDVGMLYRALSVKALAEKSALTDERALQALLARTVVTLEPNGQGGNRVLLDGRDVTNDIRSAEVDTAVAKLGESKVVHPYVFQAVRKIGESRDVVVDGRNAGTDIFPDAAAKYFLTADAGERAKRRVADYQKLDPNATLAQVMADLEERDRKDREREFAPLRKASDAVEYDTTTTTAVQIVDKIQQALQAARDIQTIVDFVSQSDALPDKVDVLFIPGHNDLKTLEASAALHTRASWVVISGGTGRLTERLRNAVRASQYAGVITRDLSTMSEAAIIGELFAAMGVPREKILLEENSKHTAENFRFGRKLLEERKIPHRTILYMQTPLQQLRTRATFDKAFEGSGVQGYSYVAPGTVPDRAALDIEFLLGELNKLKEYADKGDLVAIPIPPSVQEARARLTTSRGARLAATQIVQSKPSSAYPAQDAWLWFDAAGEPVIHYAKNKALAEALGAALNELEHGEKAALIEFQKKNARQHETGGWTELNLGVGLNKHLGEAAVVSPDGITLNEHLLRAPPAVLTLALLHGLRSSLYRYEPDRQAHDAETFQKTLAYAAAHPDVQRAFLDWAVPQDRGTFFEREWTTPLTYARQLTEIDEFWRGADPDSVDLDALVKAGGVRVWRELDQTYVSYDLASGLHKVIRLAPAETLDILSTNDASETRMAPGRRIDIVRDAQKFASEIVAERRAHENYKVLYLRAEQLMNEPAGPRRSALIAEFVHFAQHRSKAMRKAAADILFSIAKTHPDRAVRLELNPIVFDLVTERPAEFGRSRYNFSALSGRPHTIVVQEKGTLRARYSVNGGTVKEETFSGDAWILPVTDGWVHYLIEKQNADGSWTALAADTARGLIKFQRDVRGKRILGLRPAVFNEKLDANKQSMVDDKGNVLFGTFDELIAQIDSIAAQGFNELYIQALEMGAPGEAGPDASPYAVMGRVRISERLGGMKKLLELRDKARAKGIEISLDLIPHLSRSDRSSPPRTAAWIVDQSTGKPVRRAATAADSVDDQWFDSEAVNMADPRNVRDITDAVTKLALLGFNFRIDVGHTFDTNFPPDPRATADARRLGQIVTAEREGRLFKTFDLRDEHEIPNNVLTAVIYEVKKRALAKNIRPIFYSENWHGQEPKLILSGVDAPFNPLVRNLWETIRDEKAAERFVTTLRYLEDIERRFGGQTVTVINNQDAEVPPVDAFGDRAFAAVAAAIFSSQVLFQYIHYSFRKPDGSVDWPRAFAEVFQIPVNNIAGPARVNGRFWQGGLLAQKIENTEAAHGRNQFLKDLGAFEKTMQELVGSMEVKRVRGLYVGHNRVIGAARINGVESYLGFFHMGSPHAADINFHPQDAMQGGQGLGSFSPESVWTLEEIFNNENPKASPKKPGDRLVLTGREIERLGMGPHDPIPVLGIRIYRLKQLSEKAPKPGEAGYRELLRDSLVRYHRYGPKDRFKHSFVAEELKEAVREGAAAFDALFSELSATVSDGGSVTVGDLSDVFGDLVAYEPGLRDTLHQRLIHTAVAARKSSPQESDIAIKILRSADIGEVVVVSPETRETGSTGGLGSYTSDYARELANLGIDVTVIAPMYGENWDDSFEHLSAHGIRDTGRTVTVPFGDGETQVVKLYEAKVHGVRYILMNNQKYFSSLGQVGYGKNNRLRLRFARMLSLGAMKAIVETNIHASVIQTNDWTSAYIHSYMNGREEIDASFKDPKSFEQLAGAKTMAIAHNLQNGYHGRIYVNDPGERARMLWEDIGVRGDYQITYPDEKGKLAINPTATAIDRSDRIGTVSEDYMLRSLEPSYREEFGGLTDLLIHRKGAYVGVQNGFDQIHEQRMYLARAIRDEEIREKIKQAMQDEAWKAASTPLRAWLQAALDRPQNVGRAQVRSVLELGRESDRRLLGGLILDVIAPVHQRRLQKAFGLEADPSKFLYGMLHRISFQKGHQLLLDKVWYDGEPDRLTYTRGAYEDPQLKNLLSADDVKKLMQYARTHVDEKGKRITSLSALEVMLILHPDVQFLIAGKPDEKYYDDGFTRIAKEFTGRFTYMGRYIDVKKDFATYKLFYSGGTVFGMPSMWEPGGISDLEAAAFGVPRHMTNRDGLRSKVITLGDLTEGFESFNPIDWLRSLEAMQNEYKANPVLWRELRYRALTQDSSWRESAKTYIERFRDLVGAPPLEALERLERRAAIHRAELRGEDPADELAAAGFYEEAAGARLADETHGLLLQDHYRREEDNAVRYRRNPDWQRINTIAAVILEHIDAQGSVPLRIILQHAHKKLEDLGIGADDKQILVLLGKLVASGSLKEEDHAYRVAVPLEELAVKSDSLFFIKRELESVLSETGAPRLLAFINRYKAAINRWQLYPVESRWPVLRAVAMLDRERKKILVDRATEIEAAGVKNTLIDRILIMLTRKKRVDWLNKNAPHLEGRTIYYTSAETWYPAGGLGRVGQYHTAGMKRLAGDGAQVVTIEPKYAFKIAPDGNETPMDYENLAVPVKGLTKMDLSMQVIVRDKPVEAEVWKGRNDLGIEVYLIKDKSERITRYIYKYSHQFSKDPKDVTGSWFEFAEFMSRASLQLAEIIEKEKRQKDPAGYKAPVIVANDGQLLPLATYKRILDESEPGNVLKNGSVHGVTHTYKNRMDFREGQSGPVLATMGIPHDHADSYRRIGDHMDMSSGGLRDSDSASAVSAIHRDEVYNIDPFIRLLAITNGDDRVASRAVFEEILKQIDPSADPEAPTPAQIIEVKREAKRRLGLDPDQLVIAYSGRLVPEKAGRQRAFTDENIRAMVAAGIQVVIYGNVQAYRASEELYPPLKALEKEVNATGPGRLIVLTGWGQPEQKRLLAAADVQVQDSDRATGAAEFTEADISVNAGLQVGPTWMEGIIQRQGVVLDREIPGSGNVLIPKSEQPADYLSVFMWLRNTYQTDRTKFAAYQAASVLLSEILEADLTSAEYLTAFNSVFEARQKEAYVSEGQAGARLASISAMTRVYAESMQASAAQLRQIRDTMASEMREGLDGRPSSLKMIDSFMSPAAAEPEGEVIAVDLGGTNLRVTHYFFEKGRPTVIRRVPKQEIPRELMTADSEAFFGWIAGEIRKLGLNPDRGYRLGFTFSFPTRQTAPNRGTLIRWTKGFEVRGVEGQDVALLLDRALEKKGLPNVRTAALVNDTVATLLAQPGAEAGIILGTGTNAAVWRSGKAYNLEWGAFDHIPVQIFTLTDRAVDQASPNPGEQLFEKMISGKYIEELTRNFLKDLSKRGSFRGTKERMTQILTEAVQRRSARLFAAGVSGLFVGTDPALVKTHTVAIDGSVYLKSETYRKFVNEALIELWGAEKAGHIRFVGVEDASGLGAAIAAVSRPETTKGARLAAESTRFSDLTLAINLMDVGAEIRDGRVVSTDALSKTQRLLPTLARQGAAQVYLYGGLFTMSELSKKLHQMDQPEMAADPDVVRRSASGEPDYFIHAGQSVVRARGYRTKRQETAGVTLTDRFGNPFSVGDMRAVEPELSTGDAGADLDGLIRQAHALRMTVITDFIPWVSPDAVDASNYRMFYRRELSAEDNAAFRALANEPAKRKWLEGLLLRGEWNTYFPARINENGAERAVMIKHLSGIFGPDTYNVDQAWPDLSKPETQAYYLDALKKLIDRGVDGVRIDLANILVQKDARAFASVIAKTKAHAASQKKTFTVIAESYGAEARRALIEAGVDKVYEPGLFENYFRLSRGQGAPELKQALWSAMFSGSTSFIYASNFDQTSLAALAGPARAYMALLLLASRLKGVPLMIDLRDWIGQRGQLIPVVGGGLDAQGPHAHLYPDEKEMNERADFEGLLRLTEKAPLAEVARDIADTSAAGDETHMTLTDTTDTSQPVTFQWADRAGTRRSLVMDLRDGSYRIDKPAGGARLSVQGRTSGTFFPFHQQRSEDDWGIGDFETGRQAIDLHEDRLYGIMQILPLSWSGAYNSPYSEASSRAIDPRFISIPMAADLLGAAGANLSEFHRFMLSHAAQIRRLNRSRKVRHEEVMALKMQALRVLYRSAGALKDQFQAYKDANQPWLCDHMLYLILKREHTERDPMAGWDWRTWEAPLRDREPEAVSQAMIARAEEIDFYSFTQFIADHQMREMVEYGRKKKVSLGIDMPFARDGADVWVHPEYFGLKKENGYRKVVSQGVPSEPAYPAGQYWQFYPYDWSNPGTEKYMLDLFRFQQDRAAAIRLDHVLGYYRAYQVSEPTNKDTLAASGVYDRLMSIRGRAIKAAKGKPAKQAAALKERASREAAKAVLAALDPDRKLGEHGMVFAVREVPEKAFGQKLPKTSVWQRTEPVETTVFERKPVWDRIKLAGVDEESAASMNAYLFGDASGPRPDDRIGTARFVPGPGEAFLKKIKQAADERSTELIFETLGVVPQWIRESVERVGGYNYIPLIWGLNKDSEFHISKHTRNALVTFGLHDSSTMKARWEEELTPDEKRAVLKELLPDMPAAEIEKHIRKLTKTVRERLLALVDESPAALAVWTWTDILGLGNDHRLNIPGEPRGQWVNRLPFTIQQLLDDPSIQFGARLSQAERDAYSKPWVLRLGGTLEMAGANGRTADGEAVTLMLAAHQNDISHSEKAFERLPDSSNIGPDEWNTILSKLNAMIEKKRRLRDRLRASGADPGRAGGIVVTVGTDTVEQVGLVLALELGSSLEFPVVLTAAMVPYGQPNSDAPANVALAIQAATSDELPPQVYFVSSGKLHLASRIRKFMAGEPKSENARRRKDTMEHFGSYGEIVGRIEDGHMQLLPWIGSAPAHKGLAFEPSRGPLDFGDVEHIAIDAKTPVSVLKDTARRLLTLARQGRRVGLIIQGKSDPDPGSAQVAGFRSVLEELRNARVPVFMGSKDTAGEWGEAAGAVLLKRFFPYIKARTKLAWLLAKGVPDDKLADAMNADIAGEAPDLGQFPKGQFYDTPAEGKEVVLAYPGIRPEVIRDGAIRAAAGRERTRELILYGFGDGNLPLGQQPFDARIYRELARLEPGSERRLAELYESVRAQFPDKPLHDAMGLALTKMFVAMPEGQWARFLGEYSLDSLKWLEGRLMRQKMSADGTLTPLEARRRVETEVRSIDARALAGLIDRNGMRRSAALLLARRVIKQALMSSDPILYELGRATDARVKVEIRTIAFQSYSDAKVYELGNMLLAVGVDSEQTRGWRQVFGPQRGARMATVHQNVDRFIELAEAGDITAARALADGLEDTNYLAFMMRLSQDKRITAGKIKTETIYPLWSELAEREAKLMLRRGMGKLDLKDEGTDDDGARLAANPLLGIPDIYRQLSRYERMLSRSRVEDPVIKQIKQELTAVVTELSYRNISRNPADRAAHQKLFPRLIHVLVLLSQANAAQGLQAEAKADVGWAVWQLRNLKGDRAEFKAPAIEALEWLTELIKRTDDSGAKKELYGHIKLLLQPEHFGRVIEPAARGRFLNANRTVEARSSAGARLAAAPIVIGVPSEAMRAEIAGLFKDRKDISVLVTTLDDASAKDVSIFLDENEMNAEAKVRLFESINRADVKNRPNLWAVVTGRMSAGELSEAEKTELFSLLPAVAPKSPFSHSPSLEVQLKQIRLHAFHPSFGDALADITVDHPEKPRAAEWTLETILKDPFFFDTLIDRDAKIAGRMRIDDHARVPEGTDLRAALGDRYTDFIARFGRNVHAPGDTAWRAGYEAAYVLSIDREDSKTVSTDGSERVLMVRGRYMGSADKVAARILARGANTDGLSIPGLQILGRVFIFTPLVPVNFGQIFRQYYGARMATEQAA